MGVSFILTVHITLLSILLFQLVVEGASYLLPTCAFLHEDSTNHQRREDDQMWDISPAGWLMVNILWMAHNNNNNFALLNVTLSQVQSMDVKTKYS